MPFDMPPNYEYHVDTPTQDYIQNVERENFQTDFSKMSGDKMVVYYNSQLPHLTETLIARIHDNLDAVPDINFDEALGFQQERINRELPEVGEWIAQGNPRQAYMELIAESYKKPVANDILFDVDNEIIDEMPDFMDRIDGIKAEEAKAATEALKAAGIMFDKDHAPESVARVSHQGHDFAVQPTIDVATLEDELTHGDSSSEVVLYRLPSDTGSMLRASVGYNQVEEQNFALCRATELPVLAAYNKHIHDMVSEVPDAIAFCNAQQTMLDLQKNAFEYEAPDSLEFDHAMKEVSPTYAKYGHISTNPLHRVEDTIAAIQYAVEYNNRKGGLKEYAPENVSETMRVNGISKQLIDDLHEAPYFYNDYTKPHEKRLISNLSNFVSKEKQSVRLHQFLKQQAPAKQADAR